MLTRHTGLTCEEEREAKNSISIVCRPKLVKRFLCCSLTVSYSNISGVCLKTLVKWLVDIINFNLYVNLPKSSAAITVFFKRPFFLDKSQLKT